MNAPTKRLLVKDRPPSYAGEIEKEPDIPEGGWLDGDDEEDGE